ncbi:MAG: hypothetical protein IJE91_02175 [Clostridia bacterium]|nr:hypothetical protein [Clostridia bacterium]
MELTPQLLELGKKIQQCLDEGYKLDQPNFPADKAIKTFVTNMNRKKRELLVTDPTNPICSTEYSKATVLEALGYEAPVKHKPLTYERASEEVASYFKNGGQKLVNAKQYPFAVTLRKLAEKEALAGKKITPEDLMSLFGYYDSKYDEDVAIIKKYADSEGCIDSIRGTKDYDHIRIRGQVHGCSPAEYVALISDCYFSKAIIEVGNYIESLKAELKRVLKGKTDATGLREISYETYLKVKHLREYFPQGSLDSIEETLNYLGYDYNGVPKPKQKINEKYLLSRVQAMFPNMVVTYVDHKSVWGKNLLRASLANNMTLQEYLEHNGFTYAAAKANKRLTQTNAPQVVEELREIVIRRAMERNEQLGLEYEQTTRVSHLGTVLPSQRVLKEGQVIYVPDKKKADEIKHQIYTEALKESKGKR